MAESENSTNGSSECSWLVDMEGRLKDTGSPEEAACWSKPSIFRVPDWTKNMTKDSEPYYRPRLVSLGPFHNGAPDLDFMEEHKQRAVLHVVKRSGRPLGDFVAAIQEVAVELMDAYHRLDDEWRQGDRFVEVMVTDGCFLLEIMKALPQQKAPDDYPDNDPVFSLHGMSYLWAGIRSDMALLENQLPLLALHRLEAVWSGKPPSAKQINKWVLDFMLDPLKDNKFCGEEGIDSLYLHPLDVYHKSFCGPRPSSNGSSQWESSIWSALELKQAGIKIRKSRTHMVSDIGFDNGVLTIPAISIHDGTEKVFLNLIAFERLHPRSGSDATAYMIFMDNIIDSERDVALLRSKKIIKNLLSSDKDAAKLFNMLSQGALLRPYNRLQDVRKKVNEHCARPWNKRRATFHQTYMKNPWVFISLVTAVIVVIATLLQTVYTVASFYKSK